MKLLYTTLAALALISCLFAGSSALAQAPNDAQCSVLYAGQTTEVGAVCVTINTDTVLLDYLLIGDWKLKEAHAWIGDNRALLPVNSSGNPQIGLFPHKATNLNSATHSFTIPLSSLPINADTFCNADVFVAAHAVVTRVVSGGGSGGGGTGGDDDDDDDDHDHDHDHDHDDDHDGKSDKSCKSDKDGKSCKSEKSEKSEKSDKSCKSENSDKSCKSEKSDKDSSSKGKDKGSSSSAKSSGGKTYNATSSYGNSSNKSSASNSSSSNKSSGSSSYGNSGSGSHAGHKHGSNQPCNEGGSGGGSSGGGSGGGSSGGGSGGGTTNPVVQTESAWAGTLQITPGGSWASYFTFKNDFCEPVVVDPGVVLPQGCFNVFVKGNTPGQSPLTSVSAFTPVGISDGATGYLNGFNTAGGGTGFAGRLLAAGDVDIGGATVGYWDSAAPGVFKVRFNLTTTTNPTRYLHSSRIYVGGTGSFANTVSPALYGLTDTAFPEVPVQTVVGSDLPAALDVVVQATICTNTANQ